MNTFADVISKWRVVADLAAAMGEKPVTVRQWRGRDNIPSEYWERLVRVAHAAGFTEITLELLASLAASKARTEPKRRSSGSAGHESATGEAA